MKLLAADRDEVLTERAAQFVAAVVAAREAQRA